MPYIGNGYEVIQESLWTRWCEARLNPAPVTSRRLTKRTEQKSPAGARSNPSARPLKFYPAAP